MDETTTVQGREITKDDIELVRRLIRANPSWNRTRLSKELCLLWNWHAANSKIKDMACRSLLLKLEQRGHITLPGRQSPGRGCRKVSITYVLHNTASIACSLASLNRYRSSWLKSVLSGAEGTLVFWTSSSVCFLATIIWVLAVLSERT